MNSDRILVPFEPWHLERLNMKKGSWESTIGMIGVYGPAYTGFKGYEAIAIGGVSILWPGVGEAFIFASELIKKNQCWFHKKIVRQIIAIEEEHGLHRIQASVRVGNLQAQKWIERLGFKSEGEMKKFGPDKTDCIRYARVSND